MSERNDTNTDELMWDRLNSTLGSDASGGHGVLPHDIRALRSGQRLVRRVEVAQIAFNDNGSIRAILDEGISGDGRVLIVAGAAASTTSVIGGITALELLRLGFAGLVTDGAVRDSAEIRESGFQVWCRGTTPIASAKRVRLERPKHVVLGSVIVRGGDVVLADDDGVVVWPAERVAEFIDKAVVKESADADRLRSLSA